MPHRRKTALEKKKKSSASSEALFPSDRKAVKNKTGHLLAKIIHCKLEMPYNHYRPIEKKYMSGEKTLLSMRNNMLASKVQNT